MTTAGTPLDRDLQAFAIELFERSGGIADWPSTSAPGSVVVPPELAAAAGLPGEEFALATSAAPGCLQVGLAGEFLEAASRVLAAAVPRDGAFRIADRYLTTRDLSEKVAQSYGWQNARVKVGAAEPALVEYHLWTLLGSMRSEDVWEGVVRVAANAENQAVVELPDLFQEPDLEGDPSLEAAALEETGGPSTYPTAVLEGKRRLSAAAAEFVLRLDQRLARDRKRLQDYYRALGREADGSKRRTAVPLSKEEVAAKKRAVDLELRRKLAEVEDRYAVQAALQPLALARVRLPALVAPATVQRKQALRKYRLYWNALLKKFEPLSCSRCRSATFSATFADDTVDLLCPACAEAR